MTNAMQDNVDQAADLERTQRSRGAHGVGSPDGLGAVMNLSIKVSIVLGSSSLTISQLMALEKGAIVRLDQRIGDPVDLQVNGKSLARGELVVQEDDMRFGLKIADIVSADGRVATSPTDKD